MQPWILGQASRFLVIWRLDQVSMVACLLQLYHNVDKTDGASLHLFSQSTIVPRENVFVVLFLKFGHINPKDLFNFGRKIFFHILLDTTKNKRFKDFVKFGVAFLFGSFAAIFIIEIVPIIKLEWHDEMKKIP